MNNVFLLEIDMTSGYEVYGYYATGKGYVDIANGITYLPLIIDLGTISQYMFGNGSTKSGDSSTSLGRIVLNNTSRRLNIFAEIPIHGRALRIYELASGVKTLRAYGLINSLDIDTEQVILTVKNPIDLIKSTPILPVYYAGTNDGSTIFVEGDGSLVGNPKPLMLGNCTNFNMTPVLVNRSLLIYQISFMPISDINNVKIGGTGQTERNAHPSLASLVTAASGGAGGPIPAGEYDYFLGGNTTGLDITDNETGAYFALGTIPDKPVTFGAVEGYTSQVLYPETFTNAVWTKTNSTGYSGSFQGNTTNGVHSVTQNIAMTSGNTQFLTTYVKKIGNADGVEIRLTNPAGTVTRTARIDFRGFNSSFSVGGFIWYLGGQLDSDWAGYRAVSFTIDKADVGTTGNGTLEYRILKDDGSGLLANYLSSFASSTSDGVLIQGTVIEEAKNDFFTGGSFSDLSFFTWHFLSAPKEQSGTPTRGNYPHKILEKIWVLARKAFLAGDVSYQMIDPDAIMTAYNSISPRDTYSCGIYITDSSTTVNDVIQKISDSAKLAFFEVQREDAQGNVDIYPYIKYFAPAVNAPYGYDTTVKSTISSEKLLGYPKIRFSTSSDNTNGIPTGKVIINHTRNYTVLNEADLYGTVDPTRFKNEYLSVIDTDATALTDYANIYNTNQVDTLITGSAGADARATLELNCYSKYRRILEVTVPLSIIGSFILGDVIEVKDRKFGPELGYYSSGTFIDNSEFFATYTGRLIGITRRFPSVGKSDNMNTATLQIWV